MQGLLTASKRDSIQTHDIYYAAFLMARGAHLDRAELLSGCRRKVLFEFSGNEVMRLAHEYISGEAVVNLRFLKSAMDHLKGIVFEKMNEKGE